MQKVIAISLTGHTRQFRLTEEAYADIDRYLSQARARLGSDADPDEVIGDLERSIGERLDALAPDDRVLDATQVRGVLDEIGAVDGGPRARSAAPAPSASAGAPQALPDPRATVDRRGLHRSVRVLGRRSRLGPVHLPHPARVHGRPVHVRVHRHDVHAPDRRYAGGVDQAHGRG